MTVNPHCDFYKCALLSQVRKYINSELDEIDIINVRQIQGVYDAFKDICQ